MKHFDEAIAVVIQGEISSQDVNASNKQLDWIQDMKSSGKPVTPLFDFTKSNE